MYHPLDSARVGVPMRKPPLKGFEEHINIVSHAGKKSPLTLAIIFLAQPRLVAHQEATIKTCKEFASLDWGDTKNKALCWKPLLNIDAILLVS